MFILFWAIIVIALISIPILIGYFIFRIIRTSKFKILSLPILVTSIIVSIYFAYSIITVFDPVLEKVEIKQNIGGILICNSVYISDIHSWQYDVTYKYKIKDRIIDIGNGTYYEREWNKDEQLIKYKDWIILKTGGWIGYDKIIIGNLTKNKWSEYEFTAENIEKEKLWQEANIKSLLNYCCSEVFIDHIENGNIELHYKYRTSETLTDKYEVRKIYYSIDNNTGKPIMIRVN